MTDVSRLPGPMIDAWEWQYEAACRDLDLRSGRSGALRHLGWND